MKQQPFIPQITNVEILNYPVQAGRGNFGIAADVMGQRCHATIGFADSTKWSKASADEKPVIAMGLAAHAFRDILKQAFSEKPDKIQTPGQLMYHTWNEQGRKTKGEEWDIMVNDKKLFPHNEETGIIFDVHDGFAVGEYLGSEYLMTYPTMRQVTLNSSMRNRISNYIGTAVSATRIMPYDVAMNYGIIVDVHPVDRQIDWQTQKAIHLNANFRQDAMFEAILNDAGYTLDIDLPRKKDGTIRPGFMLVDNDNCITDFRPAERKDEVVAGFYHQHRTENGDRLTTMLDLYCAWKDKLCNTRIADIHVRQAPGDNRMCFISCKIDGEQQVSRKLNVRDTDLYHGMLADKKKYGDNPHDRQYEKALLSGFAVHYFKDALTAERSLSNGLKR